MSIRTLSPKDAQALIAAGGVDVIDVRNRDEWDGGHLAAARLVPLDQLRADPAAHLPHDKVLFVCARGMRSQNAAQIAAARGFTEVYSLDGGLGAWTAAGLPIEKPAPVERPKSAAPNAETPSIEPAEEPALDAVIGRNLRELRNQRGLSLDALAGQTGVSRSMLGQIELGRVVPGVNVIWKIARAFNLPFSAFLTAPGTVETQLLRASKAKRLVSADGRFSSRALFPFDESNGVEFYELWLAPHGREDAEAHPPGTRENLVVTQGRLDLTIGSEHHELQKGDAIVFRADVAHAYVNPGNEECWMHLVMTYEGTHRP